MAFDAARGKVVMFGGIDAWPTFHGDTWEWDGTDWAQASPATSPAPRSSHAMAYDARRRRVVLFGGVNGTTLQDTWEWDGKNWTQANPVTSPVGRIEHAMAFDAARGNVVLFGGRQLADTWLWQGTTWVKANPATSPPSIAAHSMAFDSFRNRVVLAGGNSNFTWLWDGATWQQSPAASPSGRYNAAMSFDARRQRMVLFGGTSTSDTWEWDGTTWSSTPGPPPLPPARRFFAMAYDEPRQEIVIFGGSGGGNLADTWTYFLHPGASYRLLGTGCPGSATGVPALVNTALPVVGQGFAVDVVNAPPITPCALFFSFTPTTFDLGRIGAPGCTAYANAHVIVPFITDFNGAWFNPPAFPIPDLSFIAGTTFWNQLFLVDRQANALGVITSNGGAATVGY